MSWSMVQWLVPSLLEEALGSFNVTLSFYSLHRRSFYFVEESRRSWRFTWHQSVKGNPTLTHLLFVDVCFLFYRATDKEVETLQAILSLRSPLVLL